MTLPQTHRFWCFTRISSLEAQKRIAASLLAGGSLSTAFQPRHFASSPSPSWSGQDSDGPLIYSSPPSGHGTACRGPWPRFQGPLAHCPGWGGHYPCLLSRLGCLSLPSSALPTPTRMPRPRAVGMPAAPGIESVCAARAPAPPRPRAPARGMSPRGVPPSLPACDPEALGLTGGSGARGAGGAGRGRARGGARVCGSLAAANSPPWWPRNAPPPSCGAGGSPGGASCGPRHAATGLSEGALSARLTPRVPHSPRHRPRASLHLPAQWQCPPPLDLP